MLLTHSRKSDIIKREMMKGEIKPEKDPFWEERNKSKSKKLMQNPITEGFKARAVSRLHESTTAFSASTRLKAYNDETVDDYSWSRQSSQVREESNVSALKVA